MKVWRIPLIYCVSFIVCFCTGILMDMACGPETDPYDYYVSFFHNDIQGQKEYRPFYFTSYQFLYDDAEPVSETYTNAAEWSAYMGKEVSTADVERAMYRLNASSDADLLQGYLKAGEKLPDSLASNTFLRDIKKNPTALKYYRFAKGVEKIANVAYDRWNPAPLDTAALRTEGNAALKNALAEKDKFIQLRYYYQAQRLLHYAADYKEALAVYNKYINNLTSQSHVKGWALELKAGELRRLKDTVQSAYLFAKVFAQYPERRVQAYQNYKYMQVKPAQVLALASNNSEKAVIYAIDSFGNTDLNLEALQRVYQFEPTSPMVGLLLTRDINKLEEQYLTPKLYKNNKAIMGENYYYPDSTDKKFPKLLTYISKLSAFCKQLTTERKYPDYNIANLAGAYLAWMHADNANGFAWLGALNNQKLSPAMNDQKQVIQLLLSAQNIQRLNEINEGQMLPALKWLDEKARAEIKKPANPNDFEFTDGYKFTNTARDFYQHILAPAYLKQGDTTKAALVLLRAPDAVMADFWETQLRTSHISRIIRWKKIPTITPYMNFLTAKLSTVKLNYLYDLLGTAYLRDHQYPHAILAFKQIDAATLNQEPEDYYKADPFIDKINDYPKVLRYGKTKGYNKLQFAQAMSDIEQKIKTDPQNAPSYYYRYATGLYNTSHYGNADYMISYRWSADDFGRPEKYSYDADYIKTKNAEKYFLLARSLSTNEEFKAKCTFMAAKCKQKQAVAPQYYMDNYAEVDKTYTLQLRGNEYFDELKAKYKKTAIFKKAVGECSYLKDFMITSK